jgi:type IV secretory pathway VirB2 component (pilin)
MRKVKKIILLTLILILLIFQFSYGEFKVTELTGTPVSSTEATTLGNKIITALSTIGSITSVIVLIVIGIKYMLGSVEEKATYKSTLMPYIIGSVIVFGASFFAGLIYNAVS